MQDTISLESIYWDGAEICGLYGHFWPSLNILILMYFRLLSLLNSRNCDNLYKNVVSKHYLTYFLTNEYK